MSEYIKKTSIIGLAHKMQFGRILTEREVEVVEMVVNSVSDDVPAADVAPVRHGRWETVMLDHERMGCRPTAHYCSDCHQITWFRTFYCPNCGTKMDGGVDDDDN